jgi:hypothetical protein
VTTKGHNKNDLADKCSWTLATLFIAPSWERKDEIWNFSSTVSPDIQYVNEGGGGCIVCRHRNNGPHAIKEGSNSTHAMKKVLTKL